MLELFFSDTGMAKILDNLYLNAYASATPAMTCWDYIVQNATEFKIRGEKILERYSFDLDPVAFGLFIT